MSRPVARVVHGNRFILATAALVATAAWVVLLGGHNAGNHFDVLAPGASTPSFETLAGASAIWFVMMVAMMLPSVLPWIMTFAKIAQPHPGATYLFSTSAFVGGYFAIWCAFSLLAATAQVLLQHGALLTTQQQALSPILGGVLLLVAGAFQLTPIKAACLAHCRTPINFLLTHWRDGAPGAFNMGARHGVYCLACCWALMVLSFALGVMNVAWMAVLTVIIALEKMAPRGVYFSRGMGVLLGVWGAWLIGVA